MGHRPAESYAQCRACPLVFRGLLLLRNRTVAYLLARTLRPIHVIQGCLLGVNVLGPYEGDTGGRCGEGSTSQGAVPCAVNTRLHSNCGVPCWVALLGVPWWSFAGISAAALTSGILGRDTLLGSRLIPRRIANTVTKKLRSNDFVIPTELPVPPSPFIGRDRELREMTDFLRSKPKCEPRVVVIGGPPGVGKTALAIKFGSLVADKFPDGQLFADLTTTFEHALGPSVHVTFLDALQGQDDIVPSGDKDRTTRYLQLTRDRQLIIEIDDGRDEMRGLKRHRSARGSSPLVTPSYRTYAAATTTSPPTSTATAGSACGVPKLRPRPLACSFLNHRWSSRRLLVLGDQPAEDPAAPYLRCREIGDGNRSDLVSARRVQIPGPMRAMLVVMHDVLIQNRAPVP